jgi:hypothetical protein
MEINNKWTKHFSAEMDSTTLTPSVTLTMTKLNSDIDEVALMVVEDDVALLSRWNSGEYRFGQINVGLPDDGMGLWAVGIYLGTEVMLEWDVAVISKRGEIYKILDKLQHQQYFHVCVFDISGRSHELIEITNPYRSAQHESWNFIQDVDVDSTNVQELMRRTYDHISSDDVQENLRAAAFS